MKKQMMMIVMTIFVGAVCVINGGITVNAAELNEKTNYELEQINSDRINSVDESSARGLFSTKYIVTATKSAIRSGAGTSYSVIGYIYRGSIVEVKSISNGWAKTKFNGTTGYIKASDLEKK